MPYLETLKCLGLACQNVPARGQQEEDAQKLKGLMKERLSFDNGVTLSAT